MLSQTLFPDIPTLWSPALPAGSTTASTQTLFSLFMRDRAIVSACIPSGPLLWAFFPSSFFLFQTSKHINSAFYPSITWYPKANGKMDREKDFDPFWKGDSQRASLPTSSNFDLTNARLEGTAEKEKGLGGQREKKKAVSRRVANSLGVFFFLDRKPARGYLGYIRSVCWVLISIFSSKELLA